MNKLPYTVEHGVLYRNPLPHVRSIHAYFPSVVAFSENHLGASVVLGQAFEAADLHVAYFESLDGGKSWRQTSLITAPSATLESSTVARIALTESGELLAMVARHERSADDTGLTQAGTLAFVPTTLELYRSADRGQSWSGPEPIVAPVADTSFEMCSPIRFLANGDWFWPTSTWPIKEVDVSQFQTGGFISKDAGKSWAQWQPIYPNNDLIYWESKVTPLSGRRLLSTSWVHELSSGKDMPNHYSIGSADGTEWSAPKSTGLSGQTMEALCLPDGRTLAIYRRVDQPGIWGAIAQVDECGWRTEHEAPLWTGASTQATDTMRDAFATLKCGAPSACLLTNGQIVITFWAVVENVSQINTLLLTPFSDS